MYITLQTVISTRESIFQNVAEIAEKVKKNVILSIIITNDNHNMNTHMKANEINYMYMDPLCSD